MHYVFTRNKHVGIRVVDGGLRIRTSVEETFFAAWVEIDVSLPDLVITELRSEILRAVNAECQQAADLTQQVVGMRIMEGLTRKVDEIVGGRHGCTHMANLVLESCHAAAVGFRSQKMIEARARGMEPDQFYEEWVRLRPKELRNSCVAFADDSPIMKRINQ
ncbi:MAG: DUF2889 domain-containing protein [Chloroflexota bacterium]|nr:MAG: DUF2889 domain-containing protein [Chloroflexota bacterium]